MKAKKSPQKKSISSIAPLTSSSLTVAGELTHSPANLLQNIEERLTRIEEMLGIKKREICNINIYEYKKAIRAMALYGDTKPLDNYLKSGGKIPES